MTEPKPWWRHILTPKNQSSTLASAEQSPKPTDISVNFKWNQPPLHHWGGLSKTDLTQLANYAADFFHIPTNQRPKIQLLFADHHTFYYDDGTHATTRARHIPAFNPTTGKFTHTDIVINRSMEVALHTNGLKMDFFQTREEPADIDWYIENGVIYCTLRSPWEAIVWLVGEEINHAGLDIRFGNRQRRRAVSEKFKQTAITKLRQQIGTDAILHDHAVNLFEVTAARQVLRLLEIVAKGRGEPERATFFREMYRKSVNERLSVIPRTALILEQLFLWTGFEPDDDDTRIKPS